MEDLDNYQERKLQQDLELYRGNINAVDAISISQQPQHQQVQQPQPQPQPQPQHQPQPQQPQQQNNLELKWTNGTKCERSYKKSEVVNVALEDNPELILQSIVPDGFTRTTNKREGQNEKLLDRGMMIQKSINPFLNNKNYISHINDEAEFLRPKNSFT